MEIFETYKAMGGKFFEGPNDEVDGMYKVIGIFDEEPIKPEKPAKKAKNGKK